MDLMEMTGYVYSMDSMDSSNQMRSSHKFTLMTVNNVTPKTSSVEYSSPDDKNIEPTLSSI